MSGTDHPLYSLAITALQKKYSDSGLNELSDFYLRRLADIENEIDFAERNQKDFRRALTELETYLKNSPSTEDSIFHEKVWHLFFPEGVGVFQNHLHYAENLRKSRIVRIKRTNPDSIKEPGLEILFTSNVLLGIPNKNTNISKLEYNSELEKALKQTLNEPQLFWYDHPVQIGVSPEANEILYGLSKLDKSLDEERDRGNLKKNKVKCVLSVSVTHNGLHEIARDYIARELQDHGKLKNLEVYVFTETDTRLLIEDVFLKITEKNDEKEEMRKLLQIIGVDGEYGRHYSFLKAISAIWNVLIDPKIKATFKIDLDQVFAQKELIEQTGYSAFEHFKTPLWGATGIAKNSEEVELGMIAGALVNEKDIHKNLYTPDVVFPDKIPGKEANIFFSKMLMALSTEGELMTRYKENTEIDGRNKCIERIHVTGGTNGILVRALKKHRPFTPSFIGRAEDQCYILSVLANNSSPRLAYLHKDGLIMRHDKKAFASEAVKAARFGNIIGDYIRMLYFTEYAKIISKDVSKLKKIIDPFTGCFVSRIPITVCILRFALKGAEFYEEGKENQGNRFLTENSRRLEKAIQFVAGNNSALKIQAELERKGWNLFYDVLDKFESLIVAKDPSVSEIVQNANKIISNCKLRI
ncbi:MAG: hypothetical protein JXB24_06515 [Bacteroidales bacterium]|nr:hypothetical protein [Bacteroidales bacterium]